MKPRVQPAPISRAVMALAARAVPALAVVVPTLAVLIPGGAVHAQPGTLRETTVTGTRLPDTSAALPMGVTVITQDEIRASGATTVNDALVRILGLPGRQDLNNAGNTSIDLRGFGANAETNQVIVIDGQRINEADLGSARLAGLPIDTVERIEVLRGSGAVLYGEGATGGVIVVTTRAGAGTQRRNTATVYGGVGTDGLRDARASGTVAFGGLSLDASAQQRRTDGFRPNSASDTQGQSLGVQWSNERVRIGAATTHEDVDARLPGPLSLAQYNANPRGGDPIYANDWARVKGRRDTVFASTELGAWQLSADLGWREQSVRSSFTGFAYDYDIGADTQALRARHDGRWGALRNVLVLGHDRSHWTRQVLGAFGADAAHRGRAWYVRDDLTLASGTRLSAGWRTESIARTDTAAFGIDARGRQNAWELGASQPLGGGATVYARLGSSFRLPHVDEFSFTAGGTALRPQRSRDIELGARWTGEAGGIEARLWRSNLRDEIAFDDRPFPLTGNTNLDPTRRQGVELDAHRKVASTLTLRANAALRRATFRSGPFAGNDVNLVPRHTLALRADWVPASMHRVSAGLTWVSSQYADLSNRFEMPSYTTADLRYAYQWRQAELSLGVTNLFDRRHFTSAFVSGGSLFVYPEAGRRVTAAVRLSF